MFSDHKMIPAKWPSFAKGDAPNPMRLLSQSSTGWGGAARVGLGGVADGGMNIAGEMVVGRDVSIAPPG